MLVSLTAVTRGFLSLGRCSTAQHMGRAFPKVGDDEVRCSVSESHPAAWEQKVIGQPEGFLHAPGYVLALLRNQPSPLGHKAVCFFCSVEERKG